jgi:ribosomal protein L7/L12
MDLAQVVTGEKEEIASPENQEKKEEETQDETAKPSLTDYEKKLVKDGHYILAIKEVRTHSPLGLKEAKDLVDAYKQKLAQESTNKPYKELKKPRDNDKKMVLKVPAKFKKIHAMGMKDLLMQPISELRTYASQVLFLVGASKIPGGKLPLCGQIIKLRKNYK